MLQESRDDYYTADSSNTLFETTPEYYTTNSSSTVFETIPEACTISFWEDGFFIWYERPYIQYFIQISKQLTKFST